jgi:hypothetical protein
MDRGFVFVAEIYTLERTQCLEESGEIVPTDSTGNYEIWLNHEVVTNAKGQVTGFKLTGYTEPFDFRLVNDNCANGSTVSPTTEWSKWEVRYVQVLSYAGIGNPILISVN